MDLQNFEPSASCLEPASNLKGTLPIETPNLWGIIVGRDILVTNGMKVDIMAPNSTFQKWEYINLYWVIQ